MNAILFSSRNRKRAYEAAVKKAVDFKIVDYEILIKGASIKKIEEFNPHVVIIDYSASYKDIEFVDFIYLIKMRLSDIRIIFNFGKVEDYEDDNFKEKFNFLMQQKVYDVVIPEISLTDILEKPMHFGDARAKIEEIANQKKSLLKIEEVSPRKRFAEQGNIEVNLDYFSLSERKFDINTVTEIIDEGEEKIEKCIIISFVQLQHHNGCTHTSFEFAQYLKEQGKNPCIIMVDDDTYNNMLMYYHIKTEAGAEGMSMKGIHVLPYGEIEKAKNEYSHVIIDIGYIRDKYIPLVSNSDIKIMMCSASEWDVFYISRFLNYPKYDYVKEMHYLFNTSQHRYLQLNKSLLKGNCSSYRLGMSDNCFVPCVSNKKVYKDILRCFNLISPNNKHRKKIMKLK